VLRLDPENPYALLYLQKLYEEQHQWAEAFRIREQLVELTGRTRSRSQAILGFLENALGSEALKAGEPRHRRGQALRVRRLRTTPPPRRPISTSATSGWPRATWPAPSPRGIS
jgi:hypothetical protein